MNDTTTLYRLFSADCELLYVGIAQRWYNRMAEHASQKAWWPEVVNVDLETFPSREAARAAERQAIRDEKPVYNVACTTAYAEQQAFAHRLRRIAARNATREESEVICLADWVPTQ